MASCRKIQIFSLLSFLVNTNFAGETLGKDVTNILKKLSKDYDRAVRPHYGAKAVTVGVSAYILSLNSVSEENMDFSMDMYFRQFWHDPRLEFNQTEDIKKLTLLNGVSNPFWEPDTFFVNGKDVVVHKEPNKNELLRILPSGEILLSRRMKGKFTCPMNLQYFPMDSQLCYVEIESFGYTAKDIRYKWNDGLNSVQISADVSLPEFKVLGHRQKIIDAKLSTGDYTRLTMEIQLVRSSGYYMIDSYIPTIFLVLASFVSCLVSLKHPEIKIGIPMACLLAMLFLMRSINSNLPKISYYKAIDVHSLFCTIQILFVALGNVLMVLFGKAQIKKYSPNDQKLDSQSNVIKLLTIGINMVHPCIFIIFEIAYWSYYYSVSRDEVDDLVYTQ